MKKVALIITMLFLFSAGPALAETIKIGVLYPLTGGAASAGREMRAGAEMAADIVNKQIEGLDLDMAKNLGIKSLDGATIELIFKDHESNPTLGADLAKNLIQEDKVVGIFGCWQSSVTKTVSAVCEREGVPMINVSSSSPELTKRGFKWFWRAMLHESWFSRDFFNLMKGLTEGKVRGVARVPMEDLKRVAVASERTEFGASHEAAIKPLAAEFGFDLKRSLLYTAKSVDLSGEVRSLAAARPDIVMFASYTSDAILMMKTMKAQQFAPKVVIGAGGFNTPEFEKALDQDRNGLLIRSIFSPKLVDVKKICGQVNKLYQERVGHDFSDTAARGFTAVQIWAALLEKAGSTNPEAIQAAANTLEIPGDDLVMPWAGVKFATTKDESGQNVLGRSLVTQWQKDDDGKMSMEIIYPLELATADMIYPFTW